MQKNSSTLLIVVSVIALLIVGYLVYTGQQNLNREERELQEDESALEEDFEELDEILSDDIGDVEEEIPEVPE